MLDLSDEVVRNYEAAIRAFTLGDVDLAREVIDKDELIDQHEVEVEEECLKILALHQPVAVDLRTIIAVLKINNDIERIGDLAGNIASRTLSLERVGRVDPPADLSGMARLVETMIRESLDAFLRLDTAMAQKVRIEDATVDQLHREMYHHTEKAIKANPDKVASYFPYLSVARYLERIADHATNIAEDVIYLVDGEISRHTNPEEAITP